MKNLSKLFILACVLMIGVNAFARELPASETPAAADICNGEEDQNLDTDVDPDGGNGSNVEGAG